MHWAVAAPFTIDPEIDRWLMPFVAGERHQFTMVPVRRLQRRPSWHDRRRRTAGPGDWASAWSQGTAAWGESRGGVITVFPHLAVVAGIHQRLRVRRKPVVAWCFNLGALYPGLKGAAARFVLACIDRFVVHSRAEVVRYAQWLDLPSDRFRFVPLQRGLIPIEEEEDQEQPFILAMGSAGRDYAAFFDAVRVTGHPTVVVAASHAMGGLAVPANVELRSSLLAEECHRLAQRARMVVVPLLDGKTACGQVTILDAMRMGRPVVATSCPGSEDYLENDSTGLLVEPRDVGALRRAIERLWDDGGLRQRLGRNAARFAAEHCSDEAAGKSLRLILDEVEDAQGERKRVR
jgi:glycosyltransferase involved in cell wall biosynthesis